MADYKILVIQYKDPESPRIQNEIEVSSPIVKSSCEKHGYEYLLWKKQYNQQSNENPYWKKVRSLIDIDAEGYFQRYDLVVWFDSDVLWFGDSPLEPPVEYLGLTRHPHPDETKNHLNGGVIYFNCVNKSWKAFLQEWFSTDDQNHIWGDTYSLNILLRRCNDDWRPTELPHKWNSLEHTQLYRDKVSPIVLAWHGYDGDRAKAMAECIANRQNTNMEIAIDDSHLDLIYGIVRSRKPYRVLEFGLGTGRTTRKILDALDANDRGMMVTVESGQDVASNVINSFKPIKHTRHDLITTTEEKFVAESDTQIFDVIVCDADHHNTHRWFNKILEMLTPDGIAVLHDVFNSEYPNLRNVLSCSGIKFHWSSIETENCERGLYIIQNPG